MRLGKLDLCGGFPGVCLFFSLLFFLEKIPPYTSLFIRTIHPFVSLPLESSIQEARCSVIMEGPHPLDDQGPSTACNERPVMDLVGGRSFP